MPTNPPHAMPDRHYRTVVTNNCVCIQLSFHLPVPVRATLLLQPLPCVLVKVKNRRAMVIMYFGAAQQEIVNDLSIDSTLLHPG